MLTGWSDNTPENPNKPSSLPSSREVSVNVLNAEVVKHDEKLSNMMMLWGQFHDHDVTLTPLVKADCSTICENTPQHWSCFPIPTPDDPERACMPFTRSSTTCMGGTPERREQVNIITAFTDASNVYGSDLDLAEKLRGEDGKLKVNDRFTSAAGKAYMPFDHANKDCRQQDPNASEDEERIPCFLAGDKRSNEHLALTAIHTIFVREHNRLASIIKQMNPDFNSDAIYFETRKLMGAIMQVITWQEFLPKLIGDDGIDMMGKYKGYNSKVDPSAFNVFSTAAYRSGHTMIHNLTFRLDENLEEATHGNLPLHLTFFSPWRLIKEGGLDPILWGIVGKGNKVAAPNENFDNELLNNLFALKHNKNGLDLGAINLQRGRDHGLGTYNDYRAFLFGEKARATTFEELSDTIKDKLAREKIKSVYKSPDDIDVIAGASMESHDHGIVGPTFQKIIVKQFKHFRDGDR